jgi:hypothetical protein
MHTYYALYIGSIPIPVAWCFKRHEAEIWAAEYYPHERNVEIRAFDFSWPANTVDHSRPRPSTFLVLPHRSPPQTRRSS